MSPKKKVRKAIIPAAGFGTRFLPATKASPKEMLPIVDKPVIQYVVEDAIAAGIEDIIIVTGYSKRSIEDHFDHQYELEKRLEEAGKTKELAEVRDIARMANFIYVRQKGPLGNATPIWNARHIIGDEPFLVLWGDDFFDATPSRAQQLVSAYEQQGGSAILSSVRITSDEDYNRYGIALGTEKEKGLLQIRELIEKPGKPVDSTYAISGGLLFEPSIFDAIGRVLDDHVQNKKTGEVVYVDAINYLLKDKHACYALQIQNGHYYDCGNKLEYLKTVVEFGLKHPDLRDDLEVFLKKTVQDIENKK